MAEKIKISDLVDFSDVQQLDELLKRLKQANDLFNQLYKTITQEQKDVQNGIKGTEKAVKDLSDALKNASDAADIKKLSDQIEKQAAANKKLTAQNEKLVEQNTKLKESQKAVNEEGKEAERLLKQQEKLKAKISQATSTEAKENAILAIELKRVNKEVRDQAKALSATEDAYEKLRRETREAKNESKRLGAELLVTEKRFGKTSKEAQELSAKFAIASKKANDLDKDFKELNRNVGDFQVDVGNYQKALDGVSQGFQSVLEFATPAGLALAAGALAIEGIGVLAETVKETNTQLSETAQLTGLNGEALTDFTGKIRATVKTFDTDYKETLQAVNTLQKEFGLTGDEALDLVNKGFLEGAGISDDYLDNIKEYSTQFVAAGKTAEEFIDSTIIQAKEGLLSDKFLDTVKESGLRLRELSKAQEDALQPLGEARTKLVKELVEQGESFEAAEVVINGLKEVNLTAKQTQAVVADVFGSAGEDLGRRGLDLLATFEEQQRKINEEVSEQELARRRTLAIEQELANAEVRLGEAFKSSGKEISIFFKQLQTLGIEGILFVVDEVKEGFEEVAPLFQEAGTALDDLANALGLGGSGLVEFLKRFNPVTIAIEKAVFVYKILLNTITFIVNIFVAFVDIIKVTSKELFDFATSFDFVSKSVENAKDTFKLFTDVFKEVPNLLSATSAAFTEFFIQLETRARKTLGNTKDLITGILSLDPALIKQAFSSQLSNFEAGGKAIAAAFEKGYNEVEPISSSVKEDIKKTDEIVQKAQKEQAAKTKEQQKKVKDDQDKALNERLKGVTDAIAKEKLELTKKRSDQLISEEEFQDELQLLKLRKLEEEEAILREAKKDTVAVEQQIQDILLEEQRKGEKEGLEQQKKADKAKLEEKKKQDAALLEAERKAREDRANIANDPIIQGAFDAVEERFKENQVLAAGLAAFRASLENGDDTSTATQNGVKAIAGAQVFKSLSKGFHDGGYTGDGNEYAVAGVVHKQEHVIKGTQTSKYNMRGWSANDFDNAVDNGYFNQFADTNNMLAEEMNYKREIIVNNDNQSVVDKIEWLAKQLPETDNKWVGDHLLHTQRKGNVTRTTTFKNAGRSVL
jgi:phage-related minor tail protein